MGHLQVFPFVHYQLTECKAASYILIYIHSYMTILFLPSTLFWDIIVFGTIVSICVKVNCSSTFG
jgi:hypothetical protein